MKLLVKIQRMLFRLGWLILAFVFLSTILGFAGIIEVNDRKLADNLLYVKVFMVFFAMILVFQRIFSDQDNLFISAIKIFVTLLVSLLVTWLFSLTLFISMCSWSTEKVLMKHKKHISISICQREFGCGAVDSSPPAYSIKKSIDITPFLVIYLPCDTSTIDPKRWQRVNPI